MHTTYRQIYNIQIQDINTRIYSDIHCIQQRLYSWSTTDVVKYVQKGVLRVSTQAFQCI